MYRNIRFRWLLLLVLIIGGEAVSAEPCVPPAKSMSFPASDLVKALEQLSDTFSYHLVIDPTQVEPSRIAALAGCETLDLWIKALLANTGLSYRLIGDTLVVFKPRSIVAPMPLIPHSDSVNTMSQSDSEVLVYGHMRQSEQAASPQNHYRGEPDVVIKYDDVVMMGITDLASALEMASGVKLEQERYMIIRGMKGRYQAVRINGGVIPGLGPSHTSVPMDIFPVSILNHVDLRKSVYADAPGNSTAGMVNIETLRIPDRSFANAMIGVGYQEGVTRQDSIRSYQGDSDWLGRDDGARALPDILRESATQGGVSSLAAHRRKAAGESVPGLFGIYKGETGDNLFLNLNGAHSWQADDVKWGVTGSIGYKNMWQNLDLDSQLYGRSLDEEQPILYPSRTSKHERVENTIDVNALVAGGLSVLDTHHLGTNILWLRQSTSYTERIESALLNTFGSESGQYQQRSLFHWTELELLFQQVYGKHEISYFDELSFLWQLSSAQSEFYQPYNMSYRYNRLESRSYQAGLGFDQLQIKWLDMREDSLNSSGQFIKHFDNQYGAGEVKLGFEQLRSLRDGSNLLFSFEEVGNITDNRALLEQPDPSVIFSPSYIVGDELSDGFLLVDQVLPQESDQGLSGRFYAARNKNKAFYFLGDITLWGRLQLVQGIRQEYNKVEADLWDYAPESKVSLHDEHRLLPSFSAEYSIGKRQAIRIGYSKTVAWPGMSELLPLHYEEIDTRILIRGNETLEPSDISNIDMHWSYSEEGLVNLDVLLFHKDIENAIEGVFLDPGVPGATFNSYTFKNAPQARVFGYEIEMDINVLEMSAHELNVSGSYARLYSRVSVDSFADNEKRALQGQPSYITGLGLRYQNGEKDVGASLFYKRSGEELYIVSGTLDVPSVHQAPIDSLHLSVHRKIFENASVTFSVDNLLGKDYRYRQGSSTYLNYHKEPEFALRLSATF